MCPTCPEEPSPQAATPSDAVAPDRRDAPAPLVRGEPIEVSDGVFVISDNRVPIVPNIGIVIGDHAALVVDTGIGPRNGRYVLDQAKRLAGDRHLYVTLTHFHPEHGFGAQAFKGAATIIYNATQRTELRHKGAAYAEMFRGLSPAVAAELADVRFVEPDVTYTGEAEVDLGGRTVALREVGPAHTLGDQIVLVDDRVLFGGDLLENRMFPIAPYFPPHDTDVDVRRWITVLDQLLDLDPAIVVPGHGEVADTSLIRDVRDYLDHVGTETARLRARGATADEAADVIGEDAGSRWSTWEHPEWTNFAVRAFYHALPTT
ncbi:MBL fold metallo-hydrolase [Streptomyces lydicus]|uniref:MBL fold metallo-hydrolase n=1 Tax=Streptomyces lydicus TaxID=47763 RepID=UPI00099F6CB1|nr:MBL fold metallo-hydrolase [Streptomyces lydicus]